ncbi:PBSX family phage terminase large subunit [Providencia thailandensis]|uniref:PBSX family phage terminase large subunit n=2 Tax=Providencia stuartii TaxID=588 RepID=A0AAJ1N4Q9_PROST|nr:PBSX family phage terminase large subunit [Providencia thailandensis]MDE5305513.1 PBSX family phage terminase large subunit [Providencia stuartii]MDE8752703.1 PBSX family phage terminase large subunit [Providencia thailandensis]MDE8771910.1 PBSX family phage terminase large subunit [Providencia thailandensis]MDE8776208.1 PBSX family phage terminase large subunit [Providencia thailandensis]MDE8791678.1 PBSX family phage terminase large subunit [Providencia thailandensis]
MTVARIEIPPKLVPVFENEGVRYRGAYGGRGSAKTRTFALMTAIRGYMAAKNGQSGVILCAREYMNSLEESSMEEVKQAIRSVPWLNDFYELGEKYIRTKCRSVSYVFAGLRHNLDSIKSKARILIAWVDEAESVSETAWTKLTPTVREAGSEIWVTWNPEKDGSATDKRFRKEPPDNAIIVEMNYDDNPWFPSVLEEERLSDQSRLDQNTYAWIWEGAYLENSDKQVLANKYVVQSFPDELWKKADRLLFGADFGFAKDPNTLIRMFILDDCLYIEREAYGVGVELDNMPAFYDEIPEARKWPIKADSARPETISYLKRQGFNISAAKKWQGSVEDGITYLRGFKQIIIHPRCKETAKEARLYSYKTDRITGEVLPVIEDAYNHCWDAVRYGLDGYITQKSNAGLLVPKRLLRR